MGDKTTIRIDKGVKNQLNDYKLHPRETYEDLIKRIIIDDQNGEGGE